MFMWKKYMWELQKEPYTAFQELKHPLDDLQKERDLYFLNQFLQGTYLPYFFLIFNDVDIKVFENMIKEADINGDGEIEFDEFKDIMEKFFK